MFLLLFPPSPRLIFHENFWNETVRTCFSKLHPAGIFQIFLFREDFLLNSKTSVFVKAVKKTLSKDFADKNIDLYTSLNSENDTLTPLTTHLVNSLLHVSF